jgi:stage II sporulation protein R
MSNWLKNESKIIAISLAIGLAIAFGAAAYTYVYSMETQRDIAENVIRFHVRAHSDSFEEQNLKDYVRSEILEEFASTLSVQTCVEETRGIFMEILPELQEHAQGVVRRAGFNHEVSAEMATVFFPTQFDGNIAFPPGKYEAVQIIIGDGEGQNWWCLMFPPLCYVDMTKNDTTQQLLAENISQDTLNLLMFQESSSADVVVRFRMVEWWQNLNR